MNADMTIAVPTDAQAHLLALQQQIELREQQLAQAARDFSAAQVASDARQQQLQNQIAAVQAQLEAAQAPQQAAQPAAIVPPPPMVIADHGAVAIKLAKPPKFHGDTIDPKPAVNIWLMVIDNWLNAAGAPEEQKLPMVVKFLGGRAATWWFQRATAGEHAPDTYATFKQAMLTNFKRPNAERYARDRLAALRQTGTVAEYAAELRSILMELPAGEVSDMEAYDRFYRDLKPHLARELNKTPQPNWNVAIIFTERIEGATVLRGRSARWERYAYADDDAYVAAEPNASADTYEDGEDGEYYDDDECYDQDDNGGEDGYGEDDNGDADPDADEAPMELGTITGGVQDNGPPL